MVFLRLPMRLPAWKLDSFMMFGGWIWGFTTSIWGLDQGQLWCGWMGFLSLIWGSGIKHGVLIRDEDFSVVEGLLS